MLLSIIKAVGFHLFFVRFGYQVERGTANFAFATAHTFRGDIEGRSKREMSFVFRVQAGFCCDALVKLSRVLVK